MITPRRALFTVVVAASVLRPGLTHLLALSGGMRRKCPGSPAMLAKNPGIGRQLDSCALYPSVRSGSRRTDVGTHGYGHLPRHLYKHHSPRARGSNVEAGTGHPVWPVLVPGIQSERAVSVKKPRKGKPDACRGLRVRVQPVWRTNHRPPADYRQEPVPADSAEWIALPRPPRADRT